MTNYDRALAELTLCMIFVLAGKTADHVAIAFLCAIAALYMLVSAVCRLIGWLK